MDALRITQISTGFLYDGVNPLEAESRHLTEIEGTLSHDVCTGRTEMLIDLLRGRRRDLERGQQGHQDTHPAGFRIGVLDLRKPLLCNKADQVVVIAIGAPGFCGYAAVLRFHPKDRIFAGRIEKQYLVQCCNNAHSTSPPFLFTLPAKQLFSHGIFAIQTP